MKNYDKINHTFDGDVAIFGDHYSIEQSRNLMKAEKWDDDSKIMEFTEIEHIWIHFGFVRNDDGERTSGWIVLDKEPKNKQGCIKATMVYERKRK